MGSKNICVALYYAISDHLIVNIEFSYIYKNGHVFYF